jgi:3-methyladenine DNA glycosylase AlkD
MTCLRRLGNKADAEVAQRFFKTGPGAYGEGDVFLGIRVPVIRKQVRACRDLPMGEVKKLLGSRFHEARLLALLLLVERYRRGTDRERERIYKLYLARTRHVNNWDLVDLSAEHIVGAHLAGRSRRPLHRLARSADLWERRIAILSTFHFIRQDDFAETLALAELLLHDSHDLIHKAVGWLLREVGKRDRKTEVAFLKKHYRAMPRTMLRYAIERFPERERRRYLKGRV